MSEFEQAEPLRAYDHKAVTNRDYKSIRLLKVPFYMLWYSLGSFMPSNLIPLYGPCLNEMESGAALPQTMPGAEGWV